MWERTTQRLNTKRYGSSGATNLTVYHTYNNATSSFFLLWRKAHGGIAKNVYILCCGRDKRSAGGLMVQKIEE